MSPFLNFLNFCLGSYSDKNFKPNIVLFFSPQHPSMQAKVVLSSLRVSIPEEPGEEIHQESTTPKTILENSSSSSLEPLPSTTTPTGGHSRGLCTILSTTKTHAQNLSPPFIHSRDDTTARTTTVPATSSVVTIVEETDNDGSQEGRDFDRLFSTPPRGSANTHNSHSPESFNSLEDSQHIPPSSSSIHSSASVSGKLKKVATVTPMSSSDNTSTQKDNNRNRYKAILKHF